MDETYLDASKIPRFQFQIHNEELTNCIKELHFQFKTQDKKLDKLRKDMQARVQQGFLSDLFIELTAGIDIHPSLLKELPARSEAKHQENQLKNSCNKYGWRMGQMNDVMRLLSDKIKNLERRLEMSETQVRQQVNEKTQTLQNQLQQSKRALNKQNRSLNQSIVLTHNKYEEKLKEIESKTLWQINDCKAKLNDRVNEQYVKDYSKEAELRIMNKVKQSMIKGNIDPQVIDNLQSKTVKLEKELEIKMVEVQARINEIKDNIELNLPNRREIGQEKLENQKKFGNLQVAVADVSRRIKNLEQETIISSQEIKNLSKIQDSASSEVTRIAKMVSNLKLSDDFQKLMENLDPHKLCEMDTSITALNEKDLKIQREIDTLKRYIQKFREKVEICNLLVPGEQGQKMDKEEISKIMLELISANSTFKKISVIQGQLYEFKAYGDMINELSKRLSKVQKEFDIQGVVYGLRGLEEYLKKELLVMNTKFAQLQSQLIEEKRRRPVSAKKTSDTKISSSVSFKRLVPVDCISCFQNPIGERTPERATFLSSKRN